MPVCVLVPVIGGRCRVSLFVDPAPHMGGFARWIEQRGAEKRIGRDLTVGHDRLRRARTERKKAPLQICNFVRGGKVRLGEQQPVGDGGLFDRFGMLGELPQAGSPTGGPFGENRLVYHDEFVTTEIGQVGTQFDFLGHIGIAMGTPGDKAEMRFYNGHTVMDFSDAYGLKKLGVENCKPLFARGHLVDIAGLKGHMMEAGEEITLADLRAALQKQNMQESDIKPGDGIFFNTGWGSLWKKNSDKFNSGEPGIGLEIAQWVIEKDLCLTGGDTWAVEAVPNPDKTLVFPLHMTLQTKHGIMNHENLFFDDLIADKKYQFVYIFTPVPIVGATGSPGVPIGIV